MPSMLTRMSFHSATIATIFKDYNLLSCLFLAMLFQHVVYGRLFFLLLIGFSLLRRDGGESLSPAKNQFIPSPTWKNSPQQTPPTSYLNYSVFNFLNLTWSQYSDRNNFKKLFVLNPFQNLFIKKNTSDLKFKKMRAANRCEKIQSSVLTLLMHNVPKWSDTL